MENPTRLPSIPILGEALAEAARNELRRRAERAASADFLLIDFYRIRRRTALRLPLKEVPVLPPKVGVIEQYPWHLWIMWAMESRLVSLHATAQEGPGAMADLFNRDLAALLQWTPEAVVATGQPLFGSHLLRCLVYLHGVPTRRHETSGLIDGILCAYRGVLSERQGVLRDEKKTGTTWPKPCYNINCIPLFAMASAASRIDHHMRQEIEDTACETMLSLAEARKQGWTEGWSYDAFVQDFLADWLLASPGYFTAELYETFQPSLLEPFQINCPGGGFNPPILADAECPEMYFHWSAAAKWLALSGDARLAGMLKLADLKDVSSDALLWWPGENGDDASFHFPVTTPNAVVLHSETTPEFAVTAGAANCQNGHLHADRGHVCIGSKGRWIIQDPGYRQYLRTSEHHFATGPASHNEPAINSQVQTLEGMRAVSLKWEKPAIAIGANAVVFHLGNFYPGDLEVSAVTREIRLEGDVLITDTVTGARPEYSLSYHWHFHPEAYLGEEDGGLLAVFDDQTWSLRCTHSGLSLGQVSRLRGSRGQQTLKVEFTVRSGEAIGWRFTLAGDGRI